MAEPSRWSRVELTLFLWHMSYTEGMTEHSTKLQLSIVMPHTQLQPLYSAAVVPMYYFQRDEGAG